MEKLKKYINILLSTVVIFVITGCSTKLHEVKIMSDSKIKKSAKVAVIPFTGKVYTRTVTSEWITYHLQKRITNQIISPAMVEKKLSDQNLQLIFKQEKESQQQASNKIIRSQPADMILEDETKKHQVNKFSTQDLLKIGGKIDVDVLVSGSVSQVIFPYGIVIEIKVLDVNKHSVIAIFNTSSESYIPHEADKAVSRAIKNILPDIVNLFAEDNRKKL